MSASHLIKNARTSLPRHFNIYVNLLHIVIDSQIYKIIS
nr:MAG TPA: hypothetical protein [Caudoviricetes sp.]